MSEPTLKSPSAVWGRMRIWCQNVAIGDYSNEYCALYPSYLGFKRLAEVLPSLWREEFDGLSDLALWNNLDKLLYGYHGDVALDDHRTLEECQRDWSDYADFDFLTNWGEQFDRGGKSFIFCDCNRQVRILNRCLPQELGLSLKVPLTDVMKAIESYLLWFGSEAARLGHPVL